MIYSLKISPVQNKNFAILHLLDPFFWFHSFKNALVKMNENKKNLVLKTSTLFTKVRGEKFQITYEIFSLRKRHQKQKVILLMN